MRSFEEYLAREDYLSSSRSRAAAKRREDRHMTREQKKQRGKRKLAYLFLAGVFLATLLVLLSLLTVTASGSSQPVQEDPVSEESGQQAVVCVFAVTVDKP